MQNGRYPEGYLPKIAYHIFKGNDEKVNYFVERQEAQYGEMSGEEMAMIGDKIKSLCFEYKTGMHQTSNCKIPHNLQLRLNRVLHQVHT